MEGVSDKPIGLIGGIGLTEVHVYAQRPAPDGLYSGCPHVHAVTDEGYFVLRGTGAVEFHDPRNGYRRLTLEPGQYVHFPPLVMHRLVSDGELVILGMMGNAGLAERGEARIYFGKTIDSDPRKFEEVVTLPKRKGLEGALERRDAAVRGYMELMKLWQTDRAAYTAELERFFTVHREAMAAKRDELLEQVERGPLAWGTATRRRIDALPDTGPADAAVHQNRPGDDKGLGMCGVLRPILSLHTIT